MPAGWHTIDVPGADVAAAASVSALTAAFPGGIPPDGANGLIRVGTWPDLAQVELWWDAALGKWIGLPITLLNSADQGYLGMPNTAAVGNANDNSHLALLYVGATAYGVPNAGAAAQSGTFIRALEYAYDLLNAGLKLQGRLQGILAGNGTQTMSIVPLWFAKKSTDTFTAFGGDGTNLLPPGDAVGGVYPDTNAVLKLTSPAAALPAGAQYLTTGWQDLSGFLNTGNIASDKRYLFPRMFGKMSAATSGATSPTYGGAAIDLDLSARWTT